MKPRGKDKCKRKSRKEKGVLWVAYENGLPIAVADSAVDLSEITGVNANTIRSSHWNFVNGKTSTPKFVKVDVGSDDG